MKKIIKIITCLGLFYSLFSLVNSAQADSTDYNQLLPQITEKWESKHLFENNANRLGYALKDIDRNGTDELLIGLTNGEKWELFEVYYMNGNTPTPLFDRFWDTSFRMGTVINTYTDGSIMVFESSPGIVSYRLFQLSKENKEPTLIKKGEFRAGEGDLDELNLDSKIKIDTSTIEYTSLNLPIIGDNMDPNPPMPKSLVDAKIGDEIPLPSELVGIWINKEPNNGTKPGRASSLILGDDGSYTGTFKDGDIRGKLSRLKKVSENGFIVLKDNQEDQEFAFSVGLGGGLPSGHRLEHGMVLEGRTLYNVLWVVKEGEEDYSKPSKLVTFVNPTYGPKKIEKKAEQEVAKQGDTVAESTQDSSEKTQPEQTLFENIPVFGLVVGAGLVLVLILSIFWFKK
ncbi:hypothetical protein SK137_0612 [Streptococcus mitis]|uniref:VCBS repeat-containing protein n=1 Tax=Streptococcus mitis TaxID=28037 RepID=A0A081Q6P9_STRMT|nr:hypothetical protein [Streptococcus mitis]KEQ38622.1 hypothetical protein SK137_0612 [Streptococcus mitis]KJQ73491.1 hypothetical protein TZ91_01100 [Streptococcus mitis]